jgi:hypothetical protein
MYKILGADGKEYGPVSLEQIRQWIAQGRVNPQTRVQETGAGEWKPAAEFAEFGFLAPAETSGGRATSAPPAAAGQSAKPQKGLAITSLVLGILSFLTCFLTGIPAIICGHIAQSRARRAPEQYGGSGLATAGLVLGYVSLVLCVPVIILSAMLLPALSKAKDKAQSINCVNNLKQVGLAFRTWAIDNDGNFPFNLSTNKGGTLELALPESDGFDRNAVCHFRVMSNELSTPKILVCPADSKKQPAPDFLSLRPANVSYQMHSGTNLSETTPQEFLVVCPIHNHVLLCDGSVQGYRKGRR